MGGFIVPDLRFLDSTSDCGALPRRDSVAFVEVYRFDLMAKRTEDMNPNTKILFVLNSDLVTNNILSFLIGSHLIMSHGLGFEEAYLSLRPIVSHFKNESANDGMSVENLLRAFCCAKCLDWINFQISPGLESREKELQIDKIICDERCADLD